MARIPLDIAVALSLALLGCKDQDRTAADGGGGGGEAVSSATLDAHAFCELVMGAPLRNVRSRCGAERDRKMRSPLETRVMRQIKGCEKMLAASVHAGRLKLPAAVAKTCGKAIEAEPWKESLTVRGVGWYLNNHAACAGALIGKQDAGQPCTLGVECHDGLRCNVSARTSTGACGKAPAKGKTCERPRYAGLAAQAQRECATGLYCSFETATEHSYPKVKGASSTRLSPSPEGMFLDMSLSAPIARSTSGKKWSDDAANFGLSGLLNSGYPAKPNAPRGIGIGLGSIAPIGGAPRPGTGQGFSGSNQHRARPPKVRMGAASVTGRLPPEVIQRIARQNLGRFRLCYENGLKANPKLQGRVTVRFVITRDGKVSNVGGGGDLPDGKVISCITRAFYGLSFPKPEGGIVTVTYPIVFSPGKSAADAAAQRRKLLLAAAAGSDAPSATPSSATPVAPVDPKRPTGPRNTCTPRIAKGASCWESWQCVDGLRCLDGQCAKGETVAAGGSCKEHTDCAAGAYCEGTCKARKKVGETCRAAVECHGACREDGKCVAHCGAP